MNRPCTQHVTTALLMQGLVLVCVTVTCTAQYGPMWQTDMNHAELDRHDWSLQASPCPGQYTNDVDNHHFTADCSLAVVPGDVCFIPVHTVGYSGGSVTCTGVGSGASHTHDGAYATVPATATPCTGTLVHDVRQHFTADCSSATHHGDTCTLTHQSGYADGAVTCNTALARYVVVEARVQLSPGEIVWQPEDVAGDVDDVLLACHAVFGVDGTLRSPTDCVTDYVCSFDDPNTRDWLRRRWPELAKHAVCSHTTTTSTTDTLTETVTHDNGITTLSLCTSETASFPPNGTVTWEATTGMPGYWDQFAMQFRPVDDPVLPHRTLELDSVAFVVTVDGVCYYFMGAEAGGPPPGCDVMHQLGDWRGLHQTGPITNQHSPGLGTLYNGTLYSGTWSRIRMADTDAPIRFSDITMPGRYTDKAIADAKRGSQITMSMWNSHTRAFAATDVCMSMAVNDYGEPAYDGVLGVGGCSCERSSTYQTDAHVVDESTKSIAFCTSA